METPDLSSWDWWMWKAFCLSQTAPPGPKSWLYNPESEYYDQDLTEFKRGLTRHEPSALALIPQLVLWRMNQSTQGETP